MGDERVYEMLWDCAFCGTQKLLGLQHRHCPSCGAEDLRWKSVSGRGSVYTYTVAHRPPHPVFMDQCPLVIAVVELEEGPRLMTNIVGCDPEAVKVGMAVQVDFEPIDDSELELPVFRPA